MPGMILLNYAKYAKINKNNMPTYSVETILPYSQDQLFSMVADIENLHIKGVGQ